MATTLACAFFAVCRGLVQAQWRLLVLWMYPQMVKQDYDPGFAAGLITAAGGLGPIIPPSILMVTFGGNRELHRRSVLRWRGRRNSIAVVFTWH